MRRFRKDKETARPVIGEAADGCASAIRREGDSIKRWILPEVHHLASQCAGASRMKPAALKGSSAHKQPAGRANYEYCVLS